MAVTFHHELESRDGLAVRFASTKAHPDAGVAWPWHHAIHAMARIAPIAANPIAAHFGDALYEDDVLEAFHSEIFVDVVQSGRGESAWVTSLRFTDGKWIPSALVEGFRWDSSA